MSSELRLAILKIRAERQILNPNQPFPVGSSDHKLEEDRFFPLPLAASQHQLLSSETHSHGIFLPANGEIGSVRHLLCSAAVLIELTFLMNHST